MRRVILVLLIMLLSLPVIAFEPPNLPADIAIAKLKEGNYRFSNYKMKHPNLNKTRRDRLINGQHPFAAIITCSDSRIVPEFIFDQGLGDLFVIRNAGDVLDEDVMESIEYAVHHLGVNLVVVMGHEFCGAVGAAMKGDEKYPEYESIIKDIAPAIEKCKKAGNYSYENVIKTHVRMEVDRIFEKKDLHDYYMKHDLKIIPAYYSISTGEVEFLNKLD